MSGAQKVDLSRLDAIPPMARGSHKKADEAACLMANKLAAHTIVAASGCHLWTGYIQPNGYGYVNIGRHHEPAHRMALKAHGVEVPVGMDVCHRCDVRNCVNPAHLYVGTRRQNMADCTARNRHNKPIGEKHWRAKLSTEQVQIIRDRHNSGQSNSVIAADIGVHNATISRIVRRISRQEVA